MAKIILDIGNTALKWAFLHGDETPKTCLHDSEIDLKTDLLKEWEMLGINEIFGTVVSRPQIREAVENYASSQGGFCRWFYSEKEFNGRFRLLNSYSDPKKLGADRWYGAIGAIDYLPGKSIILVQFGTATTADIIRRVDENNYVFEGGYILPGFSLMYKALEEKIPALAVPRGQRKDFPKDTGEAIKSGVILAQLGPVISAVKSLENHSESPVQVLLTGGAVSQIDPEIGDVLKNYCVSHNIVLRGIKLRAELC